MHLGVRHGLLEVISQHSDVARLEHILEVRVASAMTDKLARIFETFHECIATKAFEAAVRPPTHNVFVRQI